MNGRTVVGVYRTEAEANSAVVRLIEAGYSRDDISVIAKDPERFTHLTTVEEVAGDTTEGATTGALTGGAIGGLGGLLLGLGALAIPGIGPIIAAGPIAGLIGGALAGGAVGGLIGALVNLGLSDEEAQSYEQNLKDGDILVVVKSDNERFDRVHDIFNSPEEEYYSRYPREENRIFGERVDDPEDFSRNDGRQPLDPIDQVDPTMDAYIEPNPIDSIDKPSDPWVDPYAEDPRNNLSR